MSIAAVYSGVWLLSVCVYNWVAKVYALIRLYTLIDVNVGGAYFNDRMPVDRWCEDGEPRRSGVLLSEPVVHGHHVYKTIWTPIKVTGYR